MANGYAEIAEGGIEVVDARGRNAPAVVIRLGNVGTNRHDGSPLGRDTPPRTSSAIPSTRNMASAREMHRRPRPRGPVFGGHVARSARFARTMVGCCIR